MPGKPRIAVLQTKVETISESSGFPIFGHIWVRFLRGSHFGKHHTFAMQEISVSTSLLTEFRNASESPPWTSYGDSSWFLHCDDWTSGKCQNIGQKKADLEQQTWDNLAIVSQKALVYPYFSIQNGLKTAPTWQRSGPPLPIIFRLPATPFRRMGVLMDFNTGSMGEIRSMKPGRKKNSIGVEKPRNRSTLCLENLSFILCEVLIFVMHPRSWRQQKTASTKMRTNNSGQPNHLFRSHVTFFNAKKYGCFSQKNPHGTSNWKILPCQTSGETQSQTSSCREARNSMSNLSRPWLKKSCSIFKAAKNMYIFEQSDC